MKRRDAIAALLALGASAAPFAARAQQPGKMWRIGFLSSGSLATAGYTLDAFREGLRALGYIEGRQVAIEARWAEGRFERLPSLATELVQLKVDVIVTASMALVKALKQQTSSIPIVMASGADPVAAGFAASLARPGGNVTGLTNLASETTAKLFELAKEILPKAQRIGVMLTDSPAAALYWKDAQGAGKGFKVELVSIRTTSLGEIEEALAEMRRERVAALIVPADTLFLAHRRRIVALAATVRLPAVYTRREYVEDGGLISYGLSLTDAYRRSAIFVDKILKGATPGELPIEQPAKFELAVNLKTAKALGLAIPQSVLFRADRVIE